jgi:hypothetical protein
MTQVGFSASPMMNTSFRQWLGMVIGSNALLKIKGWVSMYPKPFAHAIIENNYFTWLYD